MTAESEQKLLTPGPTPIPARVAAAMSRPLLHHRSPAFKKCLAEVHASLQRLFRTTQEVMIFAASGTGAMEAAAANLLAPGDAVVTVEAGKFGERWGDLCEVYGAETERLRIPWGGSCAPDDLVPLLDAGPVKAVFLTHCETSTGAVIDLPALTRAIRAASDALIVVDGISSVAALPFEMDAWGIDVTIAAAQKALQCPPGLAFAACSDRAWQMVAANQRPRYYFDLERARRSHRDNTTPFTPAISLITGLRESLRMIEEAGQEAVWRRHARLAGAVRAAVTALGLTLYADKPADTVTAVTIPESLVAADLVGRLRQCGYWVAGGQGAAVGNILRIGHMGAVHADDLLGAVDALEQILAESGWRFPAGAGTAAFREHVVGQ